MKILMGLFVISMGVLTLWGFSGQYHINCDSEGNCTYHETKDYPKKITLNHHRFQLRDGDELLCYDTSTRKRGEGNKYKVLVRNEHGKAYASANGFTWDECTKQRQKLQEALDKEDKSLTFSDNIVPSHVWKMVIAACCLCFWSGIQIMLGKDKNNIHTSIH